jgi:ATP-dependent DNA helicase HFM1/MER3
VPSWNKIKPSLTLTAETSDGTLVHFWRGKIQKMDELKFTVALCRPGDKITCYVACDEVVGTIQSFTLTPNVPGSAFPPPPKSMPKPVAQPGTSVADEYGGDDLEDDEFLAAVKDIEATSENSSDEFPDIDDIDVGLGFNGLERDVKKSVEVFESVQMANGKWTCNHHCRAGQPLKNGKLCKHKCCLEGLDKPRKLKKKEGVSFPAI